MNSAVHLVGNLTKDPQRTESARGDAVCKFNIAVNRPAKETEQPPSYFAITCFGTLAENAFNSLHKGDRVILSGSLEVRIVDRDDGTKATFVNVIADELGAELRFNMVDVRAGTAQRPQERPQEHRESQPQRRQEPPARVVKGNGQRSPNPRYEFDEEPF